MTTRLKKRNEFSNIVAVSVFLLISMVLCSRNLHIALDDENYIAYFTGAHQIAGSLEYRSVWLELLDEPIWKNYTAWSGSLLDPWTAERITIFISAFFFLYAFRVHSGGNFIIISTLFIFDPILATQMYFNQLRQGLAFSIFFALLSIANFKDRRWMWLLSSFIAFLIHSSFIVFFISILISILIPKNPWIIAATAIGLVIACLLFEYILSSIDFGRREGRYGNEGALNINYYITALMGYGATLFFLVRSTFIRQNQFYLYVMIFLFSLAIGLSLIHEAAARLMYFADGMMTLLVVGSTKTNNGKLALCTWVGFIGLSTLFVLLKPDIYDDNMFSRWDLILFKE